MKQGYIKLARKVFDDPLWRESRAFSGFEAWIDLIQLAAWRDTRVLAKGQQIDVPRGHFLASIRLLAGRWQWGHGRVIRFLGWLAAERRIAALNGTASGTVYVIVNYEVYQSTGTPRGTENGTATERRRNKKKEVKQLNKEPSLAADAASGDGARPTTWLTPVSAVWESRMGPGTFPWPIAGRALRPLSEHHEGGEIAAHLGEYLDATKPEFVNLHKFSQTFAKWRPESPIDPATGWFTAKAQAWYDSLPKA